MQPDKFVTPSKCEYCPIDISSRVRERGQNRYKVNKAAFDDRQEALAERSGIVVKTIEIG
jgi:hypothetical protein